MVCYLLYKSQEKFKMTELIYSLYPFFRAELLGIVGMQTNNILILVDNNFTNIEKKVIKLAKIMRKDRKLLTSTSPLKFNDI